LTGRIFLEAWKGFPMRDRKSEVKAGATAHFNTLLKLIE
jgi:hypothetical protein